MTAQKQSTYNIFLLISTVVIWGTVWIGIKYQLGTVAESVSIFYRVSIAAIFLIIVCLVLKKKCKFSSRQHICVFFMGLCLFSLNYWLFYLASNDLESGLVSVVFASIVFFNALSARTFLKAPISYEVIWGGIISFIGMTFLFHHDLFLSASSDARVKGILLTLAATIFVSAGNTISAKLSKENVSVLESTTLGMVYGAFISGCFAFFKGESFVFHYSPSYLWSLSYLSIVCTAVAFFLYLTLTKNIGSDKAGFATLLFPIIALTLSTVFEGYSWNVTSLFGVCLIVIGTAISLCWTQIKKTSRGLKPNGTKTYANL